MQVQHAVGHGQQQRGPSVVLVEHGRPAGEAQGDALDAPFEAQLRRFEPTREGVLAARDVDPERGIFHLQQKRHDAFVGAVRMRHQRAMTVDQALQVPTHVRGVVDEELVVIAPVLRLQHVGRGGCAGHRLKAEGMGQVSSMEQADATRHRPDPSYCITAVQFEA